MNWAYWIPRRNRELPLPPPPAPEPPPDETWAGGADYDTSWTWRAPWRFDPSYIDTCFQPRPDCELAEDWQRDRRDLWAREYVAYCQRRDIQKLKAELVLARERIIELGVRAHRAGQAKGG